MKALVVLPAAAADAALAAAVARTGAIFDSVACLRGIRMQEGQRCGDASHEKRVALARRKLRTLGDERDFFEII